ncbi:CHASE2 domain-containing protein [uncultured Stenotrophomonas sp.]|uniref:CHASE2 domain-containing protein n=1 Tax=uncultured Stenotrophomonas sp. TaxID=165438 RepID=UPI0025CE4175|nr:CHASE2 domain-containing protein [uncultured Stenotrophomonas sp.]
MRPLRPRWQARLLFVLGCALLVGWLSHARVFWQQDVASYDLLVGDWNYPPDPRLAIIAIDDRSLQQLGQWPWPRSTHAQLLDRLHQAGVERVALDLMLPDADRKDASQDKTLAAAIHRNGRVVLPVLAAPASDEAVPEELLPVPAIAKAAATLAHTDIEVDGDGVARGAYLKAGIGSPHWPALGAALAGINEPLPGMADPSPRTLSPYQWHRDHYVRLRYAGPPGSFPQMSYVDVLDGRIPADLLKGRLVIVGMTASGIAPRLLTPTSRDNWMSGSEYQANVASMLLAGNAIRPLPPLLQTAITMALVALGALGITSAIRQRWLLGALAIPAPILLSLALLHGANLWFAPVAATAGFIGMLLFWTLWQMRYWRRQANRDPLTGLANRMRFEETLRRETDAARRSGRPLTLLLIDVDHFKSCNDSHGHYVGDRLLRYLGRTIEDMARRPRDLAARFGGDEFALILPDTPPAGAEQLVQSLINRVRQLSIPIDKAQHSKTRTTVTIGVCSVLPGPDDGPARLFEAADAALYQAKQAGRDGYRIAPPWPN